jgi:hypothetical protein
MTTIKEVYDWKYMNKIYIVDALEGRKRSSLKETSSKGNVHEGGL